MTNLNFVKNVVNTQLARFNLKVANTNSLPSIERFLDVLKAKNLTPQTVIDVGVADGTPWLYRAFEHAKYHLIDPNPESLPLMESWARKLNAEVHNVALGAEDGLCELAGSNDIGHASLLKLLPSVDYPMGKRHQVPVRRFDSIIAQIKRPALCKIDVEGAELMVLKGIGERIKSLDVIIVETSINSLFKDGPELRDIVAHMSEHNFSLVDIGSMSRWGNVLHFIDAIFVPDDSPLRFCTNAKALA